MGESTGVSAIVHQGSSVPGNVALHHVLSQVGEEQCTLSGTPYECVSEAGSQLAGTPHRMERGVGSERLPLMDG